VRGVRSTIPGGRPPRFFALKGESKKVSEEIINKETAEAEFNRFKKAMRLRLDREGMDENEAKDVKEDIAVLVEEIMAGRLSINDEGQAVVHPEGKDPLTFRKPSGRDVAVIDRKKEAHKVGQQFAIIGSLCDKAPSVIQQMDWDDIDICARIVGLFFVK